jgi:tight adherence protein C
MTIQSIFFLSLVFVIGSAIAAATAWYLLPDRLRQRVASLQDDTAQLRDPLESPWFKRVQKFTRPLANLSLPTEGWENSPMRIRFINAGWRHPLAPLSFFGTKTLLALLIPGIVLISSGEAMFSSGPQMVLIVLVICSYAGYYMPNVVLNHFIRIRQREIFENFPDALDLLTICVEAGLGLDAAISKVAGEIHLKSEVLAQEMQLLLLELRAGFSKERALRNLSLRTGVEDIDMLVAMLIQSDRFGTSMGDSLRIQAENLRIKRRQRAEEAAAKVSLKLLFPLIFFIFPTLMVILTGPAILQIYRNLLPAMSSP